MCVCNTLGEEENGLGTRPDARVGHVAQLACRRVKVATGGGYVNVRKPGECDCSATLFSNQPADAGIEKGRLHVRADAVASLLLQLEDLGHVVDLTSNRIGQRHGLETLLANSNA